MPFYQIIYRIISISRIISNFKICFPRSWLPKTAGQVLGYTTAYDGVWFLVNLHVYNTLQLWTTAVKI